jgi:hypothetical protein
MKSKLSQCSPEHARNSQELNGMSMDDNHSDRMMYLAMFVTDFAYVLLQDEWQRGREALQPPQDAAANHMFTPMTRGQLPPGATLSGHGGQTLAIENSAAPTGLTGEPTAAPPTETPAIAPMSMEQMQAQMEMMQKFMQLANSAKASPL